MNDSNITTEPVELPAPRSAVDHVNAAPTVIPQAVENPVDEDDLLVLPRVLLVGSHTWSVPEAVPRVLQNWYLEHGKPRATLVTDDTALGMLAQQVWAKTGLDIEVHPLAREPLRRPTRERKRRMLRGDIMHAFVFVMEGKAGVDADTAEWFEKLRERSIPTTMFSIDEIR